MEKITNKKYILTYPQDEFAAKLNQLIDKWNDKRTTPIKKLKESKYKKNITNNIFVNSINNLIDGKNVKINKSILKPTQFNKVFVDTVQELQNDQKDYAEVGDIVYVANGEKKWVNADEWNDSLGTPIGVVVVPKSHCKNGENGIMISLANMSLETPEQGTLSNDDNEAGYIHWGNPNADLAMPNYNQVPIVDPEDGTSTGLDGRGYMQTDIRGKVYYYENEDFEEVDNEDEATCMYEYDFSNGYCVAKGYMRDSVDDEWNLDWDASEGGITVVASPYLADGSKNPNFQVEGTAFENINGMENQQVIMGACTQGVDGVIANEYGVGHYPAARACSRFYTEGTNSGDWYLPSLGELAYLWARITKIAHSISVLGNKAVMFKYCPQYALLWSSTESSWSYVRCFDTGRGGADSGGKGYNSGELRVRAFCAF